MQLTYASILRTVEIVASNFSHSLQKIGREDLIQELLVNLLVELSKKSAEPSSQISLNWISFVCLNYCRSLRRKQYAIKRDIAKELLIIDCKDNGEFSNYEPADNCNPETIAIQAQENERFFALIASIEEVCTAQEKALLQALLLDFSMADLALPGESLRNTTVRLTKIKRSLRIKAKIVLGLHN